MFHNAAFVDTQLLTNQLDWLTSHAEYLRADNFDMYEGLLDLLTTIEDSLGQVNQLTLKASLRE